MVVGDVELITFGMTLCLVTESCVEFITPLLIGILDLPRDNAAYENSTWIIFILGIISTVASLFVTFMDYNGNKVLHNTPEEQEAQDLREENEKKAEKKEKEQEACPDVEDLNKDQIIKETKEDNENLLKKDN